MPTIDNSVNPQYSKGRMKNTQKRELAVCGLEAVKALAKVHGEKIRRLYFTKDRKFEFGEICKQMASRKAPYNVVENEDLGKLCGSVHHQGVVAMMEEPRIVTLNTDITDEWLHRKESAILLDRVGNANNLGAIVRSAAFFGFKNIIIPIDEAQSSITTSSYRVAQGGMEYVHVYCVHSIVRLLEAMKGKMVRFGTDVHARQNVSAINTLRKEKPALIVLGNEEHGISKEVKQHCDYLVTIPFGADEPQLESLNVAQASAIILYELRK